MDLYQELDTKVRTLRRIQLDINRKILEGKFKIPIHLGLGHEALAVSCTTTFEKGDCIFLTHRNIHFQIALGATLEDIENEYLLKPEGLAAGKLGSMNLMNPEKGNIYSSNILGNNLAVALGSGLAKRISSSGEVIWVITGDGAIEEGVFYESLLIASSLSLPIIYVIENNGWSLATKIDERRIPLDIQNLASSLSIGYSHLESNNSVEYLGVFKEIRRRVASTMRPHVVEVQLESFGGYLVDIGEETERYVNYHAGAAKVEPDESDIFIKNFSDPVFIAVERQKIK